MSDLKTQSREECAAQAKENELVAFFAEPDELFIDLDDKYATTINQQVKATLVSNKVSVISELYTTSKSGNKHALLKVTRNFTPAEAAAIQAALGSDPKREVLTVLTRDFSCLYETPDEAAKVALWRDQNATVTHST